MARLLDISPLVSERLPVWPGDTPYRRTVRTSFENGDSSLASSIETTLHVGAHADAPGHTLWGAGTIDEQPLAAYYGPCRVVRVRVPEGGRVAPEDLPAELGAPRLLIRTDSFPGPERFGTRFAGLSPGLAPWLAERGVVLVGLDTPSVDPFDDPKLESHLALTEHRIATLEGLVLRDVAPGFYTLIALPLRLEGADASPVRAVLVEG
jgi:arylformamidase